jgi:tetratricopeptide (TPR) repeat protein
LQRRYDQALDDYNRALEVDPQDGAAYRDRGNVYGLQRRFDQALEDLNKALELDPQDATAYSGRGNIYSWLRRYDQALEDLNRALELDPQNVRAYLHRGRVYSWLRRYDQALEDLNRALKLDPQNGAAYRNRGNIYSWQQHYDQALEDLNRALEPNPQDDFAYRDRGIILLGLRKKEQAYIDFNHASELNPMDIESLWIHCWAHMSKHEKDEKTIKQLEELVEQSSSHKYVTDRDIEYVCQGVAIGLRGDLEAGLDMLEKITSQQPFLVYSTQFWKGMFNAYHSRNPEIAMKMILDAIDRGMPSILLIPLYWLERDKQEFFETYALPVLKAHNI